MEEKVELKQVSEREIWVGENKIYLDDDNIINIIIIGEIDEKSAIKINKAILKLGDTFEEKPKILIDLNKSGKPSLKARKIFLEGSENEKLGKTALVGLHPVANVLASIFIGSSEKKDVRFFKTREEALAWLKE